MVAVDTSSLVAYFEGLKRKDVEAVDQVFAAKQAFIPPVVICEILSAPGLPKNVRALFEQLPVLDILPGYWQRAGELRGKILSRGGKAKLADTLIAQSCIDHKVALITGDDDFGKFVKYGLVLY